MKKPPFFIVLDKDGIECLAAKIAERMQSNFKSINNLNEEELITIDEAAVFIKLTKSTIYGLVHKNEIPYSKKGKRLYFLKSELMEWIASGKKTSKKALDKKVDDYIFKNRI